jgi:CelD/BcsL family acetyltransferase involved in cellulose biosynthesis
LQTVGIVRANGDSKRDDVMGMAIKAEENAQIAPGMGGYFASGLRASCRLALVQSAQQLRELAQDWRALESVNQVAPTVFQSFDWCMTWCDAYNKGQDNSTEIQVVTGYDGNQLVFLFPLMVTHRMGQNMLVWLTEPFGQYGDVLCAKGETPRQWINATLNLVKRFKDVDLIHLRHVREDGILAKYGIEKLVSARVPEQAPFLDLSAYSSDDQYDARYTSQQRKRRKKIRKNLEHRGTVAFRALPAGTVADAAMQKAIAEKAAWLTERGRVNRVMSCPSHFQFLKRLSRSNGALQVIVSELTAGGEAVSWEIGFRFGKTHFAYITSHLNALTDLSPGRLHMDLSQRACLADGMERFDLMVPNDAHKESWSSAKIETNDYFLPISSKGSAYGHLYLRLLRPVARDVYYWLEPRVLPWLFRKSGKPNASSTET